MDAPKRRSCALIAGDFAGDPGAALLLAGRVCDRTRAPTRPDLGPSAPRRAAPAALTKIERAGFVVWFTGLPSAGKSTLAQLVAERLRMLNHTVEVLDGDEVRKRFSQGLGFSRADRDENIRRIARSASGLVQEGVVVITAAISPYRAARAEARGTIGRFVEVYVKCPLEVCIARDVKGLYRRALSGEISEFTGISHPYEEPTDAELVVETDRTEPAVSVERILARLEELGYLPPSTTRAPDAVPARDSRGKDVVLQERTPVRGDGSPDG